MPNRTAVRYDERKNHASGKTLLDVAKAVVAILSHPERTSTKIYVRIKNSVR